MKLKKIIHNVAFYVFIAAVLLWFIAILLPQVVVETGTTPTKTYIFQLIGGVDIASSTVTLDYLPAILILSFYVVGVILMFFNKRMVKAIGCGMQAIGFAFFTMINDTVDTLVLSGATSGANVDAGGFEFVYAMVIILFVFSLIGFVFGLFEEKINYEKLSSAIASEDDRRAATLKKLYEEGAITKEEYVSKMLGETENEKE